MASQQLPKASLARGSLQSPALTAATSQHHHYGSGVGKYHPSEALKLQQGGGANPSTADVKVTGIKATGLKVTGVTTGIKTPTITTPAVKTPDVKVNVRVPTPNIRVPTIAIH